MMSDQTEEREVDPAAHARARRRAMKNCTGGRYQGRAGKDWADSKQVTGYHSEMCRTDLKAEFTAGW